MVEDKDYSIFKVYFNNNFKIILKAFDELSKRDEQIISRLGKLHNDKTIRSAMIRAYIENYVSKNKEKLNEKMLNEIIKYFEDKTNVRRQNESTTSND